jgi:hypothetical protein
MSTTAAAAGVAPGPKNLLARFVGIITAPKDTFRSVAAHPQWFGMLALCTVTIAVLVGGFLSTQAGQEAWLTKAIDSSASFGRPMSDQQVQAMEKMAPYVGYLGAVQMLLGLPLLSLVIAGISFAIFNAALGGTATFKQVFSVVVHALPIGVLSQLFSLPINYSRGTLSGAANLGVFFPMLDEHSFASGFLGSIDLFLVWQVLVLAIGLAVLFRRRTQPIAITFFGIYGVIAIAIAVFKSRVGGA